MSESKTVLGVELKLMNKNERLSIYKTADGRLALELEANNPEEEPSLYALFEADPKEFLDLLNKVLND